MPAAGAPFLLGFSVGVCLLPLAASHRASPTWIRGVVAGVTLFIMARYLAIAADLTAPGWSLPLLAFPTAGTAFVGVLAVDQLIRHPAMSPRRLVAWCALALAAHLALLAGGWRWAALALLLAFSGACGGASLVFARAIPDRRIRAALLGVGGAQVVVIAASLLVLKHGQLAPTLIAAMVANLAAWQALESSGRY